MRLDENGMFSVSNFGVKESRYDVVIIHRKLVSNLKDMIKDDQILVDTLKTLSDQVYITTGSGSISDIGHKLVENFKYIPFSIVEKCFANAVMKVNLVRGL